MAFNNFASFVESKNRTLKVGVVGYSTQKFDTEKAKKLVQNAFDQVEKHYPDQKYNCVSGLTDLGIPALAYREAAKRGWGTTGVACEKAKEHKLFSVDKEIIHGKEWGDESQVFLDMIDVLVRIGGGKQSHNEAKRAIKDGKEVIEFELTAD